MPAIAPARRRGLLRVGALAVGLAIVAATSYAFLDSSGVASTSITASTSAGVSINLGGTALSGTASASNPTTWAASGTASAKTSGMWVPQTDTPVSVVAAGDVAIVNASSLTSASNVIINLAITNTPALNGAYSYFNLPVNLYEWSWNTTTSSGTWIPATLSDTTTLSATSPTLLTLTDNTASWEVPGGGTYEIQIPYDSANTNGDDGSFYLFQATLPSGGSALTWSLSPDFYVSTQTVG